ncbi:MAG: tetratricopeptide repeat protein [Pseudomonadota bacterium]
MSLVNDMLRDLDERRRGPTAAGLGAEKLVPVTNSRGAGRGIKTLISVLGLLVLAAAVAFLGLQYFREPESFPDLPFQAALQQALQAPAERSAVPAPAAPTASISTAAPAEIAAASSVPTPQQLELEMIARRMEELEAQNRALLEAQAQMAARSAADTATLLPAAADGIDNAAQAGQLPAPIEQSVAPENQVAIALDAGSQPADLGSIDPAFADALAVDPALAGQGLADTASQTIDPAAAQQSAAQQSAAPMRSPTELSFADQDKGKTQEALTLWGRNQRSEAVAALQGFIAANPQAHQSRETLAKLMLQQSDFAAVTILVQEGMAVAPEYAGYRKLQARLLLSSGMAQEAVRVLSNQAPPVSIDNEYHDLLATAQLSTMDFVGAAKSYQSLVQQNRGEARWWYGLAAAWDGQGREAEALQAYQQALNLPSLSAGLRQRSEQRVAELRL